jgi:hypothetical protein
MAKVALTHVKNPQFTGSDIDAAVGGAIDNLNYDFSGVENVQSKQPNSSIGLV